MLLLFGVSELLEYMREHRRKREAEEAEAKKVVASSRRRSPTNSRLTNHHLHKPAVIGRIAADARIVPISYQPMDERLHLGISATRNAPACVGLVSSLLRFHGSSFRRKPESSAEQWLSAGYRLSPV